MREWISVRVADGVFQLRAAGEISALVRGVAARSRRVPVPGAYGEFGVLAIGDWAPSGGEALLDHLGRIGFFDDIVREDVHGAAERLVGIEEDRLCGGGNADNRMGLGRREFSRGSTKRG